MQLAVTTATPLLDRIGMDCGLDVASVLHSLHPSSRWPFATKPSHTFAKTWMSGAPRRRRRRRTDIRHVLTVPGIVGLDAPLQLQVTRTSVEVSFEIGPCLVRTLSGGLYVRILRRLPDVVAAAAVGRPLADLFEHRWLDDRDWRPRRTRPAGVGMWLVVETGQVPFEMPWPWLIDRSVTGSRFGASHPPVRTVTVAPSPQ